MVDEVGNKIGPHRVWHKHMNSPGLAMSRSIGDRIGKSLGVIAEPVLTRYTCIRFNDSFIVAASDGVWDVMTNEEVVDYVE
jgi:serine/threonine protein phosphatase PrpC